MSVNIKWNEKLRSCSNSILKEKRFKIISLALMVFGLLNLSPIEIVQEIDQDEESPIIKHEPITATDTWAFVEKTNVVNSGSDPESLTDSVTITRTINIAVSETVVGTDSSRI